MRNGPPGSSKTATRPVSGRSKDGSDTSAGSVDRELEDPPARQPAVRLLTVRGLERRIDDERYARLGGTPRDCAAAHRAARSGQGRAPRRRAPRPGRRSRRRRPRGRPAARSDGTPRRAPAHPRPRRPRAEHPRSTGHGPDHRAPWRMPWSALTATVAPASASAPSAMSSAPMKSSAAGLSGGCSCRTTSVSDRVFGPATLGTTRSARVASPTRSNRARSGASPSLTARSKYFGSPPSTHTTPTGPRGRRYSTPSTRTVRGTAPPAASVRAPTDGSVPRPGRSASPTR